MEASIFSLGAGQRLADRPFTDPGLSESDRLVLMAILERLRAELRDREALRDHPRPLVLFRFEPDGRKLRIVIGDAAGLAAERPVVIVGFVGTKRPNIDCAPLDVVDDELIAGIPAFPGVLGYCSMQQPSGNWANLVLLREPKDLDHWSTSPRHAFAAKAMAPEYYVHIRLHNGVLEGGVLSQNSIVLHKTKYYDFGDALPWRAVRELAQA
jgi:hypothetical protein